jgi:hypothetical protein
MEIAWGSIGGPVLTLVVDGLSAEERRLVLSYVARASQLAPEARVRLAATLAAGLRPRVPGAFDFSDDELFLAAVAQAMRTPAASEREAMQGELAVGRAIPGDSAFPERPAEPNNQVPESGTGAVHASKPTALLATARKRPLWSVFLLTAGTFSLYFPVHLGLTWAEMKRARGDSSMQPMGHALAWLVPIYAWFRFHAHVRTLDEMLSSAGSSYRVSAGLATGVYVVVYVFGVVAGSVRAAAWLILPAYLAYGAFAAWRQRALNAYYDQISEGSIPERVHPFEWVVMVVGGFFLALIAIGISSPSR